jgi:cytochrome bd-type quinol oxidase subunit 1
MLGREAGLEGALMQKLIATSLAGIFSLLDRGAVDSIKDAMDTIASYSYNPLRLCFAMSCFSYCMVAFLVILTMLSRSPLSSIGFGVAAAVLLVAGMLLLCLGVFGEYLGRVYDEVRRRPLSIINKVYYASEMTPTQASSEYERAEQSKMPQARVAHPLQAIRSR